MKKGSFQINQGIQGLSGLPVIQPFIHKFFPRYKVWILFFLFAGLITPGMKAQYAKLFDFVKGNDLSTPQNTVPVFDGTWIYDVTYAGGTYNAGVLYKVKPNGLGYAKLRDFGGSPTDSGSYPCGSLLLKGDTLFGTCSQGGVNGYGCVFSIKTNGTQFTQLVNFTGLTGDAPGGAPKSGLVLYKDSLFGNTYQGGNSSISYNYSGGVIYKVKIDGTGYSVLKDLNSGSNVPYQLTTPLLSYNGELYGLSKSGGNYGCMFKITRGGSYTLLHNFSYYDVCGNVPAGPLAIINDKIYGTTTNSIGSPYTGSYYGCLYRAELDGSGMTRLADFGTPYGKSPTGGLVADSKGNVYGLTSYSGSESIFKYSTVNNSFAEIFKFSSVFTSLPQGQLLLLNDTTLVGTAQGDGYSSKGDLFSVSTSGTNYTQIIAFKAPMFGSSPYYGSLVASGDTLVGVTHDGGAHLLGCIYRILPNGTYEKMYDFDRTRGGKPLSSLALSGNVLYGTTTSGGKKSYGCLFKINTDGTGYDSICSFNEYFESYSAPVISHDTVFIANSFGNNIYAVQKDGSGLRVLHSFSLTDYKGYYLRGITQYNNMLYGTAFSGGANGYGCLFKMKMDGTGYSNFYDFKTTTDRGRPVGTPYVIDDTVFVATQGYGGCVYKIKTDGTGLTPLVNFDATTGNTPYDGVCMMGNKLYGLTSAGMSNTYWGTMYSVNRDGSGFTKLVDFGDTVGNYIYGSLATVKGALYGFTKAGGKDDLGVVFKYSVGKVDPLILWNNPSDILVGTALSSVQLNATANVSGTFNYTPASGTVLSVGNTQTLSTSFTPDDGDTYNSVSQSVAINVLSEWPVVKTDPVITWNNPSDITYGTLLSTTQLDATANVDGTFTYTPDAGAQLDAGYSQLLSTHFVPTDGSLYNSVNAHVYINVLDETVVESGEKDGCKVYPNPVFDKVYIFSSTSFNYVDIRDIYGRLIVCQAYVDARQGEINIRSLESGIFILTVLDKNHRLLYTKQIEKVK